MSFLKKKEKPPKISPERLYHSIPVITPGLEYEEDAKGIIRILVPVKSGTQTVRTIKIKLDAIGSRIWKRIDGKTSISEIAQWMKNEFMITEREAEISLSMFIKSLVDKKLVALILPPPKPGTPEVQEEIERIRFEIKELEKAYKKKKVDEKTYREIRERYEEAIKELEEKVKGDAFSEKNF
ncbi:MAG: PqqD family protein [Candidatus Brockarchaeota archaeon]|nr:PqqD family protein [Candidatus Brockarchaeota archaeon]